jgi:hypothetical protein
VTPNSLEKRAVFSPRSTLIDIWENVESLIIHAGRCNELISEGELVECGHVINKLYEAGKISKALREKFFNMSKWHRSVAYNDLVSV